MEAEIRQTITDFAQRKTGAGPQRLDIQAKAPWDFRLFFELSGQGMFDIRGLRADDGPALHAFGQGLGAQSRDFFAPYPWRDPAALDRAFQRAIGQASGRIDASYLLRHNGNPVGHFFLWKAGGYDRSLAYGVQVPELGVAIIDDFQGRGLGRLAVDVLQVIARHLRSDGIELSTAPTNRMGWRTYLRAGYEYVGIVPIPLDVDVTAVESGEVKASRYRDERHMVYVINEAKRDAVLRYLATKRRQVAGVS